MIHPTRRFLMLAMGLWLSFACLISPAALSNTEKETEPPFDFSKPIFVEARHPEFTISLPANETTGYAWFLGRYNPHQIQALRAQYIAPKSELIGAPGRSVWTFHLKPAAFIVPQIIHVQLLYIRPWEPAAQGGEDQTITVVTGVAGPSKVD